MRWIALLMVGVALAGCTDGPEEPGPAPGADDATLEPVLTGFSRPLLVTHAGDGSNRLFVVEQEGTIQAVASDGTRSLFADVSARVGSSSNEQGLLGMAFHPEFSSNGALFLSYTNTAGNSVLSRFQANPSFDAASEDILLTVNQPFANHNGGHIVFGPDGYLYVGLGDGGLAGDPNANGQNPGTLLGSILRLDVGATGPYTIPSDNPFVGRAGADEVWVYGLRNPWRFSFDDADNLWIGDVGQDAWEEVTRIGPNQGGANLGWNTWEGTHHYPTGVEGDGNAVGYVFPVAQYANDGPHCSVTGGMVIEDRYLFGDFCSGNIWSMPTDGGRGSHGLHLESGLNVASFGFGEDRTAYVVDLGGTVQRLEL